VIRAVGVLAVDLDRTGDAERHVDRADEVLDAAARLVRRERRLPDGVQDRTGVVREPAAAHRRIGAEHLACPALATRRALLGHPSTTAPPAPARERS
jgi:hypothetical protein